LAHWEIQSWLILVLGWVFVPLYETRMKVFTMPEFSSCASAAGSRTYSACSPSQAWWLHQDCRHDLRRRRGVRTLLGIDTVNILGFRVDVFLG